MNFKTTLLAALTLSAFAFAHGAAAKKEADSEFKMMDTNNDGKISPEEHAAGTQKMFEQMDTNKDGKVSAEEMTAFEAKMGKKATKGEMTPAEKIKMIDTDGDGKLSASEHAEGSKLFFQQMDTDKDGFLSKTELEGGHALMQKTKT